MLIGFALLLSVLVLAWRMAVSLNRSAPPAEKVSAPPQEEKPTGVEMKQGILVVEVPERNERWELRFQTSHYEPETKIAVTHNSVCQVRRNGQLVTVFRAPRITVRFDAHELEMSGGVTIVAVAARWRVSLPSLRWNWQTGRLFGTGRVRVEGERIFSEGDALEGDTTLQQFSLKGRVFVDWRAENP